MNLAISWQHTTDSIAGRSVGAMFLPHVTNSEAEAMIGEWSAMEFITLKHIHTLLNKHD